MVPKIFVSFLKGMPARAVGCHYPNGTGKPCSFFMATIHVGFMNKKPDTRTSYIYYLIGLGSIDL